MLKHFETFFDDFTKKLYVTVCVCVCTLKESKSHKDLGPLSGQSDGCRMSKTRSKAPNSIPDTIAILCLIYSRRKMSSLRKLPIIGRLGGTRRTAKKVQIDEFNLKKKK